jgi:hypothetical protein
MELFQLRNLKPETWNLKLKPCGMRMRYRHGEGVEGVLRVAPAIPLLHDVSPVLPIQGGLN